MLNRQVMTRANVHVTSVFRKPQGMAIVADANPIAAANSQGEGVQFLNQPCRD